MSRRPTRRGSSQARGWLPERSREKDTLEHFERFAYTLRLKDGHGRLRLHDFWLEILQDYFAGVLETVALLPTGQAKSTIMGALALHHGTYVVEQPRSLILGGLGKHGRNTLDAAAWFVSQSPDLSRWWVPQEYGMGRIKSLIDVKGEIAVLSGGGNGRKRAGTSVEGDEPTQVIVEETHRHEDGGAALRTLTSKAGKRGARIIHVTTAGDDLESPLGRLLQRATNVKAGAIVDTGRRAGEHYRRCQDADGDLVVHEWAVPDEIQPTGDLHAYIAQVKKANPAPFITVDRLRRAFKAASSEPWVFRRQHANQWVIGDVAAIDRAALARCLAPKLLIPRDADVYVGLDTASKWDSTGIVPAYKPATGKPRVAGAVILDSPRDGTRRRLRDVVEVLEAMRERWPRMRVVFDRNHGGGLIAEQLEEDHGLTVIDHPQGLEYEQASMLLGELIDEQAVEIEDHEDLQTHLLTAVARRTGRDGKRWRLAKPADRKRLIDGAAAMAMALNVALNPPDVAEEIDVDDYRIEGL
jgi:phage terminase large subunit-like protein